VLKEVWNELGRVWGIIQGTADKRFSDVKILDIKKELLKLNEQVQQLPNHMRSFEAYDFLKQTIRNYLDMHGAMSDLSSGILRAKHQKTILQQILNAPEGTKWSDLTVGLLWRCDLRKHTKALRFVLEQAQGENALEEFLADLANKCKTTISIWLITEANASLSRIGILSSS